MVVPWSQGDRSWRQLAATIPTKSELQENTKCNPLVHRWETEA